MGLWFVPEAGASGSHDVYIEKETVEAFRKMGKFPAGAMLVKELRASEAGDYPTGKGVHYETETVKQWFVMIKDSNSRFTKNPLWGDGWGWALFKPGSDSSNEAADYKKDCLGYHVPVKNKGWIYTEAYPALRAR